MAQYTTNDLVQLVTNPSETLTIEHKGWLDLSCSRHKAILAKAAIALANEGGGIIVLGTREDNEQGRKLGSVPRPSDLSRYSPDDINNTISRFADPAFQCEVVFAEHPDTKVEHAFVIVPGGIPVPVMSCRGSDGEIQAYRCYVRKPGPKSEEPYTAEEWRGVMERCLQSRRTTMLDAIRAIVLGHTETMPVPPTTRSRLEDFVTASEVRWKSLIDPLPADDVARLSHGYYGVAFSIPGIETALTLTDLHRYMEEVSSISYTGWPPFINLHRPSVAPRPVDGMIEAWTGDPSGDRFSGRDSATCDYWRAHPAGDFFLLRGYDEDSLRNVEAGVALDLALPIWRVGETLLLAARFTKVVGVDTEILVQCKYTGLKNRSLMSVTSVFGPGEGRRCIDDVVSLETQATARQIEDNLAEVLHLLLHPLYERFSFFNLEQGMVSTQVERLRSRSSRF